MLSSLALRNVALQLAELFACNTQLGLSPTLDELKLALTTSPRLGESLERSLSALVYLKVLRCDVAEAKVGDRRFAFAHRRYQEALFVERLAAGQIAIDLRTLLIDARWRDYVVTLFQSAKLDSMPQILDQAVLLVSELSYNVVKMDIKSDFGISRYFALEDSPLMRLLELLHDGFNYKKSRCPDTLLTAIDFALEHFWHHGDLVNRRTVMSVSGLIPDERLEKRLVEATAEPSKSLQRLVFEKFSFLSVASQNLNRWVKSTFADNVLDSDSRASLRRLEVLESRLPAAYGARVIWSRCIRLRKLMLLTDLLFFPIAFPMKWYFLAVLKKRPNEIYELSWRLFHILLWFYAILISGMAILTRFLIFEHVDKYLLTMSVLAAIIMAFSMYCLLAYFLRSVGAPLGTRESIFETVLLFRSQGRTTHAAVMGAALLLLSLTAMYRLPLKYVDIIFDIGRYVYTAFLVSMAGWFVIRLYRTLKSRRRLKFLLAGQRDDPGDVFLRATGVEEIDTWLRYAGKKLLRSDEEKRLFANWLLQAAETYEPCDWRFRVKPDTLRRLAWRVIDKKGAS